MGRQADAIGAALRKQIEQACKMLVLEIDRELRRTTPVDTGHARRNWIPSVSTPANVQDDSGAAHAQGVAQVMAFTLAQGTLWVSNVVPYIQRLNYGHSQQAPAGFVETAVDAALTTTRGKLAARGSSVDLGGFQADYRGALGGQAAGNLAGAYNPLGGDE